MYLSNSSDTPRHATDPSKSPPTLRHFYRHRRTICARLATLKLTYWECSTTLRRYVALRFANLKYLAARMGVASSQLAKFFLTVNKHTTPRSLPRASSSHTLSGTLIQIHTACDSSMMSSFCPWFYTVTDPGCASWFSHFLYRLASRTDRKSVV